MKFTKCSNLTKVLVLICLLVFAGCSSHSNGPPPNPVSQPSQPGSYSAQPASSGPKPIFLDFPDVPIPTELKLASKDSYVTQAGPLKTGLLVLKGRLDINSLINFFQMAMPREGWKPKGMFRYRRSVLIFDKPDKSCVILMREASYYTYVEIYVAPPTGPM